MISTTAKYKQELIAGNRRYVVKAEVTLADNTALTLTNTELWEQGVVIDNGISSENSFDLGATIIGQLTLVIDNIRGTYSTYDFLNANVVLWMGVENDVDINDDQIYYRIGFYTVDDASYNGSLITLSCLDNMTWFDVPFSEVTGIGYPTTAGNLVADICSHVGVTLGTVTFPNYTMSIPKEPEGDNNCREILSYVAQKCCCYCKIDTAGELVLKWYDKNEIIGITDYDGGSYNTVTTPYSDGCELDGGAFMSGGDNADGGTFSDLQQGAWLTQNFDMSVSTEEIVVTGCRVRSTKKDDEYDELWVDSTLELTHERYVLVIENNPFITSEDGDAANTATTIGSILAGLPIRAFSAQSLSDFSYETGDMVRIVDFRGNLYYTWITNLTFTINNSEKFSCGAQSFKQRKETRYSDSAKTLAEAQENANKMLTDYDKAVQSMNDLAQNAIGYNKYVNAANGKEITWLYSGHTIDTTIPNEPTFPQSDNVFMISGDGVFISHGIDPDTGKQVYTQGYDANSGTAILSLIYAVGISSDWIRTGSLSLGGYNNLDGILVAFTNSALTIGSYSGSAVTQYIGYTEVQKEGDTPLDIHISNISSAPDFKGRYRLYHTTDGGTFTLIEENILADGVNRVSTILDIVNSGADYYALIIDQTTGGTATFDYSININKVVTTIDRNGISTTNGSFSGNISGSAISGSSFYLQNGGDIVDISGGKIKTQGTWIMLAKDLSDPDQRHLALGNENSAYIDRSISYQRTLSSKWIIEAAYNASQGSDKRLKKKIKTIDPQLSKDLIGRTRPVSFYYKEDDEEPEGMKRGKSYGVIAQEIREVLDGLGETDAYLEHSMYEGNDYRAVEYKEFIPHLINYAQDLQNQIDELKQELAELKARVE